MNKKLIELEKVCMKIAHEINKQRNFESVLRGIDPAGVQESENETMQECSELLTNYLKQVPCES